jgi:hypothetical protein
MKDTELIKNIIKPESDLEKTLIKDPDFTCGAMYGKPRPGHPEGQVIYHIKDVLNNIDQFYENDEDRSELRLIAILHDTFKYKVDQTKPKTGENHHGMIARRFAEKYFTESAVRILELLELHDEAYNSWQKGFRRNDWYGAKKRAMTLINKLEENDCTDLYLKFYRCDNATGDKSSDNYVWFENEVSSATY